MQGAPFARHESISLSDLEGETLLVYPNDKSNRRHKERIRMMFERFGLPIPKMETADDHASLEGLLPAGPGVTVVQPQATFVGGKEAVLRPIRERAQSSV